MNIKLNQELLTPEALENLLKTNTIIDFDTGTNIIRVEVVNKYSVGDFTISISDKTKTEFTQVPGLNENHNVIPGITKDYIWTANFINIYITQRRYYYA